MVTYICFTRVCIYNNNNKWLFIFRRGTVSKSLSLRCAKYPCERVHDKNCYLITIILYLSRAVCRARVPSTGTCDSSYFNSASGSHGSHVICVMYCIIIFMLYIYASSRVKYYLKKIYISRQSRCMQQQWIDGVV